MRDSINYNLKYFIMKKPGLKPMKNTMRKQSPINMLGSKAKANLASVLAAKKAGKTETSTKTVAPKSTPPGKPSTKPTATETSTKAPTMQMKKSGMKKKC